MVKRVRCQKSYVTDSIQFSHVASISLKLFKEMLEGYKDFTEETPIYNGVSVHDH